MKLFPRTPGRSHFKRSSLILPLALCISAALTFGRPCFAAAPIGNFTQSTAATSGDTPAQVETIPLQVTATQANPPSITIETWTPGTFSIYRKSPTANTWGTAVATGLALGANGTWTDTNVTVGTLYEYRFVNTAATADNFSNYPNGYILAGIQVDQTQPKGAIAVITAADVPVNLPAEYAQYKTDLLNDGWQVREIQVPRAVNYNGVGNGTGIATIKVTAGTGAYTSGGSGTVVMMTNASGKKAFGTLGVSGTLLSSISIPGGGCGAGFAVGDALTISGNPSVAGSGAGLSANVTSGQSTLLTASPLVGGTGYTNGDTVTLTGQTSGITAQSTLRTDASTGAITSFTIVSSNFGFIMNEPLTMTGNTTGSGVGSLYGNVSANKLTFVYKYGNDSGYTSGETGTLTGMTSGATAQVTINTNLGHIGSVTVNSGGTGFTVGETLVLSGTATGTNAPLFSGNFGTTGPLQSVTVNSGGTGYVNGANVILQGSYGSARGTLVTGSGGVITSVTVTNPGSGFTNGGYITLFGIISNYTYSVLTVDSSDLGKAVSISTGGSGYSDNDAVTITGVTSHATAVGSLIAPAGAITGVSVVLPNTFTAGEALTIAPVLGGSGVSATAGPPTSYHLLIRSAVQALYNTYPGQLKNVSIIGKVPVCRSGLFDGGGSDGHGNECSYATDAFYAEMLGVIGVDWTDTGTGDATTLGDYNLPGDSQYDQQHIYEINKNGTGGVQLGFGRIDLSLGIQTEVEAARNYFNKLHRYKVADPSFLPGRYVCDRLTFPNEREADLQSMPGVVGMQNIAFITTTALPAVQAGQDADQLYSTQNGPFLFYFKGSGGPAGGVNGKAVFWTGMQSHWGYWYQSNLVSSGANDMQLRDAENSFTLDFTWNIWGLRYLYHRMGMGLDAGDMLKTSINNQNHGAGPYFYKFNNTNNGDFSGVLYMEQIGDPALRLFMFAPPAALSITQSAGKPVLNWTASSEPTVTGYHVYRAPYASAPFTRLTSNPIAATTYTDFNVSSSSSYVYMVRAVRLEATGGGSYYNASLGTTGSINLSSAPAALAVTTTSLPGYNWNTAGSSTLAATGGYPQYVWSISSGSLPAGLTLSSAGVISGTPTAIGSFNFTVKATDQVGTSVTQALSISVNSNTANVIYANASTFTAQVAPTTSYGTYEYLQIQGNSGSLDEGFLRFDLSNVNLYNGFQKATLNLYVTNGTAAGIYALIFANLLADSVDGWTQNGISKFFSGYSNNGSNKVRVNCPGHGFTTGTSLTLGGLLSGGALAGPYAITVVDADNFDLLTVAYPQSSWTYDPALSYATTLSTAYNTRPTTYDNNVPTLLASGTDTAGTWLQIDVTPFVQEVIANNFANFPSKAMGIRLFTGTGQTVDLAGVNAFGGTVPYLVFQASNAPDIVVNSPTQIPANINVGTNIYLSTTVFPLPARAANLTLQWSKIAGPGTVAFTNPTSASTGAAFSAAGTYIVQLLANDGVATSFQNITINVLNSPASNVPASGPIDSLVLRLPFDETSGTTAYDISGASPANNGTLTTDPTTNTLPTWMPSGGKIGGALSFAGNNSPGSYQQVVVPDSTTNLLDGMQQLSISFWMYANALPTNSSNYAGLVVKRLGAFNKESYTIQLRGSTATAANIYADIGNSGTLQGGTITTGQWYHCALVFDGTQSTNNLQLYVNGSPNKFATATSTSVPRNASSNLHIGAFDVADTAPTSGGFNGLIDEVRIYNRVLTLPEIQVLAQGSPSNLGPVITTNLSLTGTTGAALTLSASVVDNDPAKGALTYNWSETSGPASLSIANPFSLSTTTTPSQPGTYRFQFMANDGIITSYATISASISGQTFASWAAANGLTGNNALPSVVLQPDGLSNLLKYALGLNPNTNYSPSSAGLPKVQLVNGQYLTLTFDGVATDITYNVQGSSDLVNWTTIQSFPSGGAAPGVQTVQDTQTISTSNRRFMRLQVTGP